jgi:hypothetical protein
MPRLRSGHQDGVSAVVKSMRRWVKKRLKHNKSYA